MCVFINSIRFNILFYSMFLHTFWREVTFKQLLTVVGPAMPHKMKILFLRVNIKIKRNYIKNLTIGIHLEIDVVLAFFVLCWRPCCNNEVRLGSDWTQLVGEIRREKIKQYYYLRVVVRRVFISRNLYLKSSVIIFLLKKKKKLEWTCFFYHNRSS